ncbi:enoyl-CoA hydratase/isomerase family protein [Halosegnis longus]|uniref:enoyl-CoA hydratase/isomerase family protein n=1 Tax=Halosegnis longus TaxID=2216012 RepID=UPI00096AB574|nr:MULTISPECIES: enoyl-CoA hydratase/isomerase family protein [Halobacteriales]
MIHTRDDDGVRVVTLSRPDARNALTLDGLDSLAAAVEASPEPVVLVRGAGEAFCAGADLATVAEVATDEARARAFIDRGQETMTRIEQADPVVVAGIDGPARGGGVELALACDVRVATPDATLAEPGVTFGLFGAWGGTVRLPEAVGTSHANDLSLSGRVVDADEAQSMGLISRVVADPRTVADELAANDPGALRALGRLGSRRGSKSDRERAEREAFVSQLQAHADALAEHRNR